MGIHWKFGETYKTVSYINILLDHRITCMQTNTNLKNTILGFFWGSL